MADESTAGTYGYREGLEPVIQAGALRPFGRTLLVRAVLAQDSYTSLQHVAYKATDAECHEIVAVGAEVAKWCKDHGEQTPEPGMHAYLRSTAADRISSDPAGRFWLVDVEDIKAVWLPIPAPPR